MKCLRAIALLAFGSAISAQEPTWKPSLAPSTPTPPTSSGLPIPMPPPGAGPEKVEWIKPQSPAKEPIPIQPKTAEVTSPVAPKPPAPPAFPVVVSDFSQPQAQLPAPTPASVIAPVGEMPPFRAGKVVPIVAPEPSLIQPIPIPAVETMPPFRAGKELPVASPETIKVKLPVGGLVVEIPSVVEVREPKAPQAPLPKITPKTEQEPKLPPDPIPDPNRIPKPETVPPGLLPKPVANGVPCPDEETLLEPIPGGSSHFGTRRGVYGSPSLQLSREYSLRNSAGLDMGREGLLADSGPPVDRWFVQMEYLLWWANQPRIPVLATTNTNGVSGFLGRAGTVNLLGPGNFGPSFADGFRMRVGGWFDNDCSDPGFDAGFFVLGRRGEQFSIDPSQYPVITRPFVAVNNNQEFGEVVSLPGLSAGSLLIEADRFVWGADINYRRAITRTADHTTGWFAGYRNLNLIETLTMTENITATGALAADPVGTQIVVQDKFRTKNTFHGGQLGWLVNRRFGSFDIDVRASVALGISRESVEISGFQQRTRPGQATQNFNGGLLAIGPNLGNFSQTRFAVVPEATVNLGYSITSNFRAFVGYNFLYWSSVIRPGDQIDRVLDVALIPNPPPGAVPSGQARPQPTFTQADFWAQGAQFGVEWRW